MKLGAYSKTIAAIIAYVLAWAAQVVASAPHAITSAEWLALAGGVAVAAGVYGATNTSSSPAPPTSSVTNYSFTPVASNAPTVTTSTPPQPPPAA